jgi:hypothetical protein
MVRPALILNVSSYVSVFPPPYLAAYAGAKVFVTAFSILIDAAQTARAGHEKGYESRNAMR